MARNSNSQVGINGEPCLHAWLKLLAALLVGLLPGANPGALSAGVRDTEAPDLPKVVKADYIDLSKIACISKFRSAAGHDFSDSFESSRSMKHYFKPSEDINWSSVRIYSPVRGVVLSTEEEWAGTKVEIQAEACAQLAFILFHLRLDKAVRPGDKVAAGQVLGRHIGRQTYSDIAVRLVTSKGWRRSPISN